MSKETGFPIILSVFLILSIGQPAFPNIVTLEPSKDNTLYESNTGDLSNGTGHYFFAGRVGTIGETRLRRGVVAFPIADNIPPGATVERVELTLYMSRTIAGTHPVSLHLLLADWGEGTSKASGEEGTGTLAASGDATWIHRFFSDQTWHTPGGDFEPNSSASQNIETEGPYTWASTPQLVDNVQFWVDNPSLNYGWILIGNEGESFTAKRFDTRESLIPNNRPSLLVEFSISEPTETPIPLTQTPVPPTETPIPPTETPVPPPGLPQDLDGNQRVDAEDLLIFIREWQGGSFPAKLTSEGALDAKDLFLFTLAWQVDELRRLAITEVIPEEGLVEVTNMTREEVIVALHLPACHQGECEILVPAGTAFSPGESKVFPVDGLHPAASDLWLYRTGGDFENPTLILTGLQYGTQEPLGHTAVAVAAGLWPSETASAPSPATDESVQLHGLDPGIPGNWIGGPPSPGQFFGTGNRILNPIAETIQRGDIVIELELVVGGLTSPLGVAEPDDGTGRLFIHDQRGTARIIQNGNLLAEPFLDVGARLVSLRSGFDERGFLGLAFHPDFAENGKLYTYTSEPVAGPADFTVPMNGVPDHQSVIAEWVVSATDPNRVDMASRRELLRIDQPQFNHDGGTLRFGPDGLLYISLGDGGAGDDEGDGHSPEGNGQNPTNILGTLVRIDVDRTVGAPSANGAYHIPADNPFVGTGWVEEIWAYGLRNPYLFSFDFETGLLWAADVGQNDLEEVNIIVPGGNYGWRLKEGSFFFDRNPVGRGFVTTIPTEPLPGNLIDPIAEYDHDDGISVMGGFVYRGSALPELYGRYVFGEYRHPTGLDGRLFYLDEEYQIRELQIGIADRLLGGLLKGFGEDGLGNIYVCLTNDAGPVGNSGRVFRIVPVQ